MTEFDYQWKNIPSKYIEYNYDRVEEFKRFTGGVDIYAKYCLDAGCGNGRYSYAMNQLGGIVYSFDISPEAIKIMNSPRAVVRDIMDLRPSLYYEFVLCWGVLHHLENPYEGFKKIALQVKPGGMLHIMVYHKDTQIKYEAQRIKWKTMSHEERLVFCKNTNNPHGWWDALNPKYNHSFTEQEVEGWFKNNGFKDIKLITKYNINMNGVKK